MQTRNIIYMTEVNAKPGREQDILKASLEIAQVAQTQEGCVDYHILQSPTDPTITMNLETWSTETARDIFNASPDVEKFLKAVSGTFAQPPQPVRWLEYVR